MRWFATFWLAMIGIVFLAGCIAIPKHDLAVEERFRDQNQIHTEAVNEVDHFNLAAEALDQGDSHKAMTHFQKHLEQFPDQVTIRMILAEHRFNAEQYPQAEAEFQTSLEELNLQPTKFRDELIKAHSRLMQISQMNQNACKEKYHRGIGLILVVSGIEKKRKTHEDELVRTTLVEAIRNLNEASEEWKADPMLHFYKAEALSRLGQYSAAKSEMNLLSQISPGFVLSAFELN